MRQIAALVVAFLLAFGIARAVLDVARPAPLEPVPAVVLRVGPEDRAEDRENRDRQRGRGDRSGPGGGGSGSSGGGATPAPPPPPPRAGDDDDGDDDFDDTPSLDTGTD